MMGRKLFPVGLTACILAVLALTGCATMGTGSKPSSQPKQHQSGAVGSDQEGADHHSSQVGKAAAGHAVGKKQPHWHPIPNPDNDLWIRVRNGYAFPPQHGHPAIQEWVNFYLSHSKHLHASLRRSRSFLWHVDEAVTQRDLPQELALLPLVESGYNAAAVSYSGAGGLWQFMPATARDMGLHSNWWYDGRFNALASTRAALDYLQWLHQKFDGNWLLALAAYNAGPGNVEDAIERAAANGQPTDYWHLDLPSETQAYVPKLYALRRLLAHPGEYGFDWPDLEDRQRTVAVSLPSQIDMDIAAKMLNMPENRLRNLNPDIIRSSTEPDNQQAELLVPLKKANAFRLALANAKPEKLVKRNWYRVRHGDTLIAIARTYNTSVSRLRRANALTSNRIMVGQRLAIPKHGEPVKAPTKPYVVQAGDTLWSIAHDHGISVAKLRMVNHRNSATLQPGQKLQLPVTAEPPTYEVSPGDTLWDIAQQYNVRVADLRKWNRLGATSALQPGQTLSVSGPVPLPDFYQVQKGDTLWSIAHQFGTKVATLRHLNSLGNNSSIRPGQRLRLRPTA